MALHDMFKQLSGVPNSITLIAAIHKNVMLKKNNKNTLVDMYHRIKSEKDFVVEELVDEFEAKDLKGIPTVYKSNMSLQISTEMSIKLLEEINPNDIELLNFLGCVPGGVK